MKISETNKILNESQYPAMTVLSINKSILFDKVRKLDIDEIFLFGFLQLVSLKLRPKTTNECFDNYKLLSACPPIPNTTHCNAILQDSKVFFCYMSSMLGISFEYLYDTTG